jgi:hypothetical protein
MAGQEDRAARLAAQLRENLRRRKARTRAEADASPPPPAPAPTDG